MNRPILLMFTAALITAGCGVSPSIAPVREPVSTVSASKAKCDAAQLYSVDKVRSLLHFHRKRELKDTVFQAFSVGELATMAEDERPYAFDLQARAEGSLSAKPFGGDGCRGNYGTIYELYLTEAGKTVFVGKVEGNVHIDAAIGKRMTAYVAMNRRKAGRGQAGYVTHTELHGLRFH